MKMLIALSLMLAVLAFGNTAAANPAGGHFGVSMGEPIEPDGEWGPKGYGYQTLKRKGNTHLDIVGKEGTREHGTCLVLARHYYPNRDRAEIAFVGALAAFKTKYGFDPDKARRFSSGIVWDVPSNPDKIAVIWLESIIANTADLSLPWIVISKFYFENYFDFECEKVKKADDEERRKIELRQIDMEREACHRIGQRKGRHLYSCSREEIEEEVERMQAMEDEVCTKLLQGRSGTCSRDEIKKEIRRMEEVEKAAKKKEREALGQEACDRLLRGPGFCGGIALDKEIKRMQAMEDEICTKLLQGRSGTCSRDEIEKEVKRIHAIEEEEREALLRKIVLRTFPETREKPISCYKYAIFLESVFREFDSLGPYPSKIRHNHVRRDNLKSCTSHMKKLCPVEGVYYPNVYGSGLNVYIACP